MSNQNSQLVIGSLGAISKQSGQSLAETFMQSDVILIVDTSGSMGAHDGNDNLSRYDRACKELALLQNQLPGKVAVISFSSNAIFCPSGIPTDQGGGTDLAGALRFVKIADVTGMKFILISDGEPGEPDECIRIAKTFKNKIDVVFIGNELHPSGRDFLERLARATGGTQVTASGAQLLSSTVQTLLLKG